MNKLTSNEVGPESGLGGPDPRRSLTASLAELRPLHDGQAFIRQAGPTTDVERTTEMQDDDTGMVRIQMHTRPSKDGTLHVVEHMVAHVAPRRTGDAASNTLYTMIICPFRRLCRFVWDSIKLI